MCIATVYVEGSENNESIMQDVVKMRFIDDGISLMDILGEEKRLDASVKSVDFIKHTVTIEMHK
jgi:predicted RNA-binding protein